MEQPITLKSQPASAKPSGWELFKQLVHLRRFAFTAFLPLMGAATSVVAAGGVAVPRFVALAAAAWCFHVFTYVFNDVMDLPVDRLMSKRARHPLVRGDMRSATALAIALVHVPLAFLFTWAGGLSLERFAALGVAFACMAVYDVWGKRFAFPPLTDFIQALSWGVLTLFGAWFVGVPGPLTFIVAAIFVVFILLMNGVFEGVIDLTGDRAAGLKTTAIVFGVHPREGHATPHVPLTLVVYGVVLEMMLTVLNFAPLIRNDFGYSDVTRAIITVIVAVLNVAIIVYSLRFVTSWFGAQKPIRDGHIDVMSALSVLIMLITYVLYIDPIVLAAIAACVIVPFVL